MNEFKFSCTHCDQRLQCDEGLIGKQIQCPSCQHLIKVPTPPGKTAQFKVESGKTWATFVAPTPPKKDKP